MAVRRPKQSSEPPQENNLELMEHLVKKSLAVNPHLAGGLGATEAMKAWQEEASARGQGTPDGQGEGAEPSAQQAAADKSARRKQAMSFFFEQKEEEFEGEMAALLEEERRLQKRKSELTRRYTEEIVDFLGMLGGASENPEVPQVLRDFSRFIERLGANAAALLQRARRR